jgi:membrane protein implicated in regulation of membrane protease activity
MALTIVGACLLNWWLIYLPWSALMIYWAVYLCVSRLILPRWRRRRLRLSDQADHQLRGPRQ